MIFAQRASAIIYKFIKTYPGKYLLPANVCPIVPLTFKLADIPFDFVDISLQTLCIDEQECLKKITNDQYSGLFFVRTYGYIYDTSCFFKKIKKNSSKLKIIDDRCLSIPRLDLNIDSSDLILYSTGYAKPIDLKYGGIGIINKDLELKDYNEKFTETNIESFYKTALHDEIFINEIPHGWLNTSYPTDSFEIYVENINNNIPKVIEHKKKLNKIYKSELSSNIVLEDGFHEWRFNILTEKKEIILKRLFEVGLFASSHYKPCNILFDNKIFPNANKISNSIINLFNDTNYTIDQAKQTCQIINNCL